MSTVRITRTFAAPLEKVFRAWIDPAAIAVWFADPVKLRWTSPPEVDARAGGRYRWQVTGDGKVWTVHGTYREVKEPERLVFTWEWENDPTRHDAGETLVTVEFFARDGGTEVVLTHEKFPSEAARRDHEGGWPECLDAMAELVG